MICELVESGTRLCQNKNITDRQQNMVWVMLMHFGENCKYSTINDINNKDWCLKLLLQMTGFQSMIIFTDLSFLASSESLSDMKRYFYKSVDDHQNTIITHKSAYILKNLTS